MDDASNWEFAASVAAICIGLAGLLLFTLIGTIGSWIVLSRASRAANEAAKATIVVQDLARQLAFRESSQPVVDVSQAAGQIAGLRAQADALLQQQTKLQDAVRNLVEAGVLGSEHSASLSDLEATVRRLDENIARIAAAVATPGQRQI